jgi:3-hydroxybutyrate dehydrogenase
MSNKVAIITGATSGIGLGIATRLAQSKTNLIINGFGKESEVKNIVRELEKYKIKCLYHNCDLAFPNQIEEMVQMGMKSFGKIDILINNAGIQHVAKIEEFPPEKWELIIRIDLISAFYTTKLVVPIMKKNGWGRIINIASAHGLVASPFKSAYVAAKHGIIGFTKSIALELAPFNITVNSVCPGYVKTDLVMNQIADSARAQNIPEQDVMNQIILKPHAIKRLIDIDEVAGVVCFLCSANAGAITGSSISVDAGWTAA